MDVILFTDCSAYLPNGNLSLPMRMAGPFRLATELRLKNISCQIIDFLWSFTIDELDVVCKKFITPNTKIVGFSSTFWWHALFINDTKERTIISYIIDYVRTRYPNCKIVCGGANSGFLSDSFTFDQVFKGYGDSDFAKYAQRLVSSATPINDSDTFDFRTSFIRYSDNDLINKNDTLTIEVSRGCIFKCKFCAYPLNGKKKLDYIKDMTVLRDEMIENYQNYNITNYIFNDDTFNDSTYKLTMLYDMFKTLPFKVRFSCYLRLDLLNRFPEQIQLLYDMGLRGAFFGVESFNDLSAKTIGKGISGKRAKELLAQLKIDHWKNEVLITAAFIIGLPYETLANVNDTMSWIRTSPVDSIGVGALSIVNDKRRTWLSEFELNHEKYGYTLENSSKSWYLENSDIKSSHIALNYSNLVMDEANSCYKGMANSNFAIFLLPNILNYTDRKYSLDDLIKMSGNDRHTLRSVVWANDIGGLYLKDYKTRLNNL